MSESSWFLKKNPWAATYFRHTPEGTVFMCPTPWIFGPSREYRLSDAQAAQLVTSVGRAYVRGLVIFCVGLLLVCLIAFSALPASPMAAWLAVTIICFLLLAACLAIVYRAAASVLAEQPWTVGEPYSLVGNLRKSIALLMMLPTAAFIAGFAGALISFARSAIPAYQALASGQLNIDVLGAAVELIVTCLFGMAIVAKLRVQNKSG
jgi:hypothetical protein